MFCLEFLPKLIILVSLLKFSCNGTGITTHISTCEQAPNEDLRLVCKHLRDWDSQVRHHISASASRKTSVKTFYSRNPSSYPHYSISASKTHPRSYGQTIYKPSSYGWSEWSSWSSIPSQSSYSKYEPVNRPSSNDWSERFSWSSVPSQASYSNYQNQQINRPSSQNWSEWTAWSFAPSRIQYSRKYSQPVYRPNSQNWARQSSWSSIPSQTSYSRSHGQSVYRSNSQNWSFWSSWSTVPSQASGFGNNVKVRFRTRKIITGCINGTLPCSEQEPIRYTMKMQPGRQNQHNDYEISNSVRTQKQYAKHTSRDPATKTQYTSHTQSNSGYTSFHRYAHGAQNYPSASTRQSPTMAGVYNYSSALSHQPDAMTSDHRKSQMQHTFSYQDSPEVQQYSKPPLYSPPTHQYRQSQNQPPVRQETPQAVQPFQRLASSPPEEINSYYPQLNQQTTQGYADPSGAYDCTTLMCLCVYTQGKATSSGCETSSGELMQPAERKEYRQLSPIERTNFHNAINAMKRSGEYYQIAQWHADPEHSGGAHSGPAFLPWHREYIKRFEFALRIIDYTVSLPYWDSTLEGQLQDGKDSCLFEPELMGRFRRAANNGIVTPTLVQQDITRNRREIGQHGRPLREKDIEAFYRSTNVEDVLAYTAPQPGCHYKPSWTSLEYINGNVLLWLGGAKFQPSTSANNPLFFMHLAFLDMLWEDWRLKKQTPQARVIAYPADSLNCSSAEHFANSPMKPFSSLKNIDGIGNHYTSNLYRYKTRPNCNSGRDEECGSSYLFCDLSHGAPHCAAKVRYGGNCIGFERNENPCIVGNCNDGVCS